MCAFGATIGMLSDTPANPAPSDEGGLSAPSALTGGEITSSASYLSLRLGLTAEPPPSSEGGELFGAIDASFAQNT